MVRPFPRRLLVLMLVVAGCAPRVVTPPPAPPTTEVPPTLERTIGEVTFPEAGSLLIRYKEIRIAIDPRPAAAGRTFALSSGQSPAVKNPWSLVDYVLVRSLDRFPEAARLDLRRDMKILSTPEAATQLAAEGFQNTKALGSRKAVLLQKLEGSLFVTAFAVPGAAGPSNGYLLEFEGGRNILVAPPVPNPDVIRDFVYLLRDDGKAIYAAFLEPAPGEPPAKLAELAALLGPEIAIVPASSGIDQGALRAAAKDQLFDGTIVFSRGEPQPF